MMEVTRAQELFSDVQIAREHINVLRPFVSVTWVARAGLELAEDHGIIIGIIKGKNLNESARDRQRNPTRTSRITEEGQAAFGRGNHAFNQLPGLGAAGRLAYSLEDGL